MQFLVTIVNKIFEELDIPESTKYGTVRGYGFLFRLENCFWTTQELEYNFFCRAKFVSRI